MISASTLRRRKSRTTIGRRRMCDSASRRSARERQDERLREKDEMKTMLAVEVAEMSRSKYGVR